MNQNNIRAIATRFGFDLLLMEEKAKLVSSLSETDRSDVEADLRAWAAEQEEEVTGHLVWQADLLRAMAEEDQSAIDRLIQEGQARGYLVSIAAYHTQIRYWLEEASPGWRVHEAPVLMATTDALLEWISGGAEGMLGDPASRHRLETHLNRLVELGAIGRQTIGILLMESERLLWRPVVAARSREDVELVLVFVVARELRRLGADSLVAAVLAAVGLRRGAMDKPVAEVLFREAAVLIKAISGGRFDRLLLHVLQAETTNPGPVRIELLDIAITGLTELFAAYGDRPVPAPWRNVLAGSYATRGVAKLGTPGHGAAGALVDQTRAIELFEALSLEMGAQFPGTWRNSLALAYMNRGTAKYNAPGYGAVAAIADQTNAIGMLEALRTDMQEGFPENWRNHLASAYTNRGNTKRGTWGHGDVAAITDHDHAIQILEALRVDMGELFPARCRSDLASAYMNRGNAKQNAPGYGAAAGVLDQTYAIAIFEELRVEMGERFPADWCNGLAGAYTNRGNAKWYAPGHDAVGAIADHTQAIELLEALRVEMNEHFPEAGRSDLASAYMNRGNAKQNAPGYGAAAGVLDQTHAIAIFEELCVEMGERFPDRWRNALAFAYSNRGITVLDAPGLGAAAAIGDLRRARDIWRGEGERGQDVRWLAPGGYLHCCSLLSGLLVGMGRHVEALEVVLEAGSLRLSAAGSAILLEEQHEVWRAGASIANLGAWLLARDGRVGEGLECLEAQHGLMLKEALLRNEHALALRVGDEAAAKISGLQARMHEVRHILMRPDIVEAGLSRPFAVASGEALREELRSLKAAFDHAVAEVGDALGAEGLRVVDFALLVPEGGVIAVPVITAFGSVVFLLSRDGMVRVLDLPELTQMAVEQRVRTLLDAEAQHKELQTSQSAAAFDAVLASEAAGYWTDLVGPLWEGLQQLGYSQSAPVTFVTTGALDLLPLHAASRIEDGVTRYAIEDRVIRCAPGFAALRQMKARTQAKVAGVERVLGVFAPQREHQKPEDQTPADKESEDLSGALYKELPRLKELLGQSLDTVVKSAATRDWFLGELAKADRPASDLHLSMHSEFIAEDPGRSGLKFVDEAGEPAPVTVSDLLALGELQWLGHVCLSSCQSGRSDAREMPGEAIGLVMAFIQAGAASVLSSYYLIGDDTTADFMPALYRHRLAGKNIAEALRSEACERLLKQRSSGSQPGADRLPLNPPATPAEADAVPGRGLRIAPARRARPQAFGPLDWAAYKPTCA